MLRHPAWAVVVAYQLSGVPSETSAGEGRDAICDLQLNARVGGERNAPLFNISRRTLFPRFLRLARGE